MDPLSFAKYALKDLHHVMAYVGSPFGLLEDFMKYFCKILVCERGIDSESLVGNCSLYWQQNNTDNNDMVDISKASKITLGVLYSAVILASLLGNIAVIIMFCSKKNVRSNVTNILILNLAISDLLITAFCMPFNLVVVLTRTWQFGSISSFTCKMVPYMQTLAVVSSILTLACIAAERYVAIILPLKAKTIHTAWRTIILVVYVWIVAILFALPNAFWYNLISWQDLLDEPLSAVYTRRSASVQSVPNTDQRATVTEAPCPWDPEELPDTKLCMLSNENLQKMVVYEWMFFVVLFLFPLLTMMFTYAEVGYRLWVRRTIGNRSVTYDQIRLRTTKRVVLMLLLVLLLFILCWAPLQIFILVAVTTNLQTTETNLNVKYYLQWLALSNSAYNPLVYTFLHEKFRKTLYTGCCCCGKASVHPANEFEGGGQNTATIAANGSDGKRQHSSNGTANTNISPTPAKY